MECKICLSNETIPCLKIDKNNICQFCIHNEMEKEFPLNDKSEETIFKIAEKIKKDGVKSKYDCLVGVSGGRDSIFIILRKKILKLDLWQYIMITV